MYIISNIIYIIVYYTLKIHEMSNITHWTSLKLPAMCSCSGCNKTHIFFSKADQRTMVFLESMWSVSWAQKKNQAGMSRDM